MASLLKTQQEWTLGVACLLQGASLSCQTPTTKLWRSNGQTREKAS